MSSPYEIARNIAQAGGKGLEQRMQQDLIGQILKDVGGDPQRANFGINQILANVNQDYQKNPLEQLTNIMKVDQKKQDLQKKEGLEQQEKKTTQDVFNRLQELTKDVGYLKTPLSKAGGKAAEDFGEFQALLGTMESELVKRVNKGTLSNTRFKYIVDQLLPNASDTQATIRGKLKGIARELNLDMGGGSEDIGVVEEQGKNGKKEMGAFFVRRG